jgi:cytochrome c oxidase subunit 2
MQLIWIEEEDAVKKLMVVTLLAPLMLMPAPYLRSQGTPQGMETREVKITAKKYEFSPNIVEVNAGTRIIFKVTALDREHGFEIADVKDSCVKIKKGETSTVEYLAGEAGTVEFRCCVFCGAGHHGMKGKIVIR